MKDYVNYEAEDLAKDEFFILWVKSASIATEKFWQNWLETYPFKRNDVEIARQLVLFALSMPQAPVSDQQIARIKESVFERIGTIDQKRPTILRFVTVRYAAALLAGLVVFASWLAFRNGDETKASRYAEYVSVAASKYELVEVENKTRVAKLVNLPDGSSVTLRKNSRLSYPRDFTAHAREIYLTGEAFFEVAKDPARPFYVYANALVTKVLGTSFNVRAYQEDKEILVSVKTGKVSVYKAEAGLIEANLKTEKLGGMVLMPNQEALFAHESISLAKKVAASEKPMSVKNIEEMSFEFDETPLGEVFAQLEKAYDIRIVYDKTVMGKCPVTASLTGEPLNEKLSLLCKAVQAQYIVANNEIVVSGKGCE
jgi:transmembrane sensor